MAPDAPAAARCSAAWPREATFLFAVRVSVALVWLHEGLYLKLIARAPQEMAVVTALPPLLPLAPGAMLTLIGVAETLLALAVLSGAFARPLARFQVAVLVLMHGLAILLGGAAIPDPLGLVVKNLPFLLCIVLLAARGPGRWVLPFGNA